VDSLDYALLLGIVVLIAIALATYFRKDEFDLRSIKDLQVEIKERLVERDALDFQSLEKAKKSSEEKTKIMREELKTLKKLVEEEKEQRGKAYTSITENIRQLHEEYKGLQTSSTNLVAALKDSTMRGNWGEVQLQRVLELSNMVKYVDFDPQKTIEAEDGSMQRPDAIVNMPGGKQLVIDSKAPGKLLEAYESENEDDKEKYMKQFADDVWETVKLLGKKKYWDNLEDKSGNKLSPDFVIMFMPGEHMLQIALFHRPALWEEAVERKVILASPYILLALLRSISHSWQQEERSRNTDKILQVSDEVVKRVEVLMKHLGGVEKGMKNSLNSWNDAIKSYESRLLKSREKLQDLKGEASDLKRIGTIDDSPKKLK
jgi:DNA recombination protein RmuC|tara:strand:+ start:1156 stop:2277 length:1122 start_codon:yes stop_codon:yes gene_type:complete